jgi:hypothetical protein
MIIIDDEEEKEKKTTILLQPPKLQQVIQPTTEALSFTAKHQQQHTPPHFSFNILDVQPLQTSKTPPKTKRLL